MKMGRIMSLLLAGVLAVQPVFLSGQPIRAQEPEQETEFVTEQMNQETEELIWDETEDLPEEPWVEETEGFLPAEEETEFNWEEFEQGENWEETEELVWETEGFQESEEWESEDEELEDEEPEDWEEDWELEDLEETETEEEEELEADAEYADTYARELEPSGTPVYRAQGWEKVSAFSADYSSVRFYPGISYMELFYDSPDIVCGTSPTGESFLYPTREGLEGLYGVIYHNVYFENGQWYDLRMTIEAYSSSIRCYDVKKPVESFPYIIFDSGKIRWQFNETVGAQVFRCEFLNSDTKEVSAVNSRFEWIDIDGAQRYGIRPLDGRIAGRYYYENSRVNVQNNQTVCGIGQMEVLVGPGEGAPEGDKRNIVCYELEGCSTYYMAFAELDHIGTPGYARKRDILISENSYLKKGRFGETLQSSVLGQNGVSIDVITTPAPKKRVSADGERWYTDIQLEKTSDTFWYEISQAVPWQSMEYSYADFRIEDELEDGIDYIGNASVIREEDGIDVTDWFILSEADQVVLVSAKEDTMDQAGFYGYHYKLHFQVKMDPDQIHPQKQDRTLTYLVSNRASCSYRHSSDAEFTTEDSNEVTARAQKTIEETAAPKKGFDNDMKLTEKQLMGKTEEFMFTIWQTIPKYEKELIPAYLEMEDDLAECLEVRMVTAEGRRGNSEVFLPLEILVSGEQKVTAKWDYDPEYAGGEIRFHIYCHLKKGADLSQYMDRKGMDTAESVISNIAAVTFYWEDEEQAPDRKETNEVVVRYSERSLKLVKEINGEDIVWEHGNPVFIFQVHGTDLLGNPHEYKRAVQFSPEDGKEGRLRKEVTLTLPAGCYTVEEIPVIRYRLAKIYDVDHGEIKGDKVLFDLQKGRDGQAVFYNEKVSDRFQSDTALVRNIFG